ncbi:MAG: hypothetical protein JST22_06455 [Bacteroidetes bacterium]|nr:hypothetical protein [Bacteroidota bacterium]
MIVAPVINPVTHLVELIRRLSIASLLGILCAAHMAAQGLSVAPTIGYGVGAVLSIRRNPGAVNPLNQSLHGTSRNDNYWLALDVGTAESQDDPWWLVGRVGVLFAHGRFTSVPYAAGSIILADSTPPLQTGSQQFEFISTQAQGLIDAVAFHRLGSTFFAGGGAWARMVVFSSSVSQEHLIAPAGAVFADNLGTLHPLGAGSGIEAFPLHGGLLLSLGANMPKLGPVNLCPIVTLRADATALQQMLGTRSLSFEASLTAHIDISLRHDTVYLPAPVTETRWSLPQPPRIEASVRLVHSDSVASGRDTATIRSRHTEYHLSTPVIPAVHFDEGSDAIPADYLAQRADTNRVRSDDSASNDRFRQFGILGVLGPELRDQPETSLTLLVPEESTSLGSLAHGRAENIQNYFADVWNIARSRIKIARLQRSELDNGIVNRNVVFCRPSSATLMPPGLEHWTKDDFVTPDVGIVKQISSRYGVRSWQETVRQGETVVSRFSDTDGLLSDADATLPLTAALLTEHPAPLTVELAVSDFVGTSDTVRNSLALKVTSLAAGSQRDIRIWRLLQPLKFIPAIETINQTLIHLAADDMTDGARISIVDEHPQMHAGWNASVVAEQLISALNRKGIHPYEVVVLEAPAGNETGSIAGIDHTVRIVAEQKASEKIAR